MLPDDLGPNKVIPILLKLLYIFHDDCFDMFIIFNIFHEYYGL